MPMPKKLCHHGVLGVRQCKDCRKETQTRARQRRFDVNGTHNAAQKAWRRRNRDKASLYEWRHSIKRKFGITEAEYAYILSLQVKRCGGCFTDNPDPSGRKKHFCVDHDHKTGEVRGLLCSRCNLILGKAGDDIEVLKGLIRYLQYVPARHFRRWWKAVA